MSELEALRAQNAEMKNLLAQADTVLAAVISMTTEIVLAIERMREPIKTIDPEADVQAGVATKRWFEFIASVEMAKANVARQNAPATTARN